MIGRLGGRQWGERGDQFDYRMEYHTDVRAGSRSGSVLTRRTSSPSDASSPDSPPGVPSIRPGGWPATTCCYCNNERKRSNYL